MYRRQLIHKLPPVPIRDRDIGSVLKHNVLAYALSIKDVQDGKVVGNIYPLDYGSHVERVKLLACAVRDSLSFPRKVFFFRLSIYSFISPFVAWQERLSRSRFRITASSRSFSGRAGRGAGKGAHGGARHYQPVRISAQDGG